MKTGFLSRTIGLVAILFLLMPIDVLAQVRGSERSTLTQQVAGTEIVIDYARPSVRDREPVFGGLVPWRHIWTPGADDATTLRFSRDVTLEGEDVPAGKYSIWLRPRQDSTWVLMLHPDTTLFHLPEPSLEDAFLLLEVEPGEDPRYTETLTFDIENIRFDGAEIQLRWGATMVPIAMGVDLGFTLTVEAGEAARYTGMWTVDASMSRPPDSLIAKWRSESKPEELEGLEKWLADLEKPQELRLEYEEATGRLLGYDQIVAEFMEEDPDIPQVHLIPKGEGIFIPGGLLNGELGYVSERGFWEFEFDESGAAIILVKRGGRDDRVMGRGIRDDGTR